MLIGLSLFLCASCIGSVASLGTAHGRSRGLRAVIGILVGAVGLLGSYVMMGPFLEVQRLSAFGETATVSELTVRAQIHAPPRADFSFRVGVGRYRGSNDIGGELADLPPYPASVEIDSPSNQVRYLPNDPQTNRLDVARTYPSPTFWMIFGLFLLRFALAALVMAVAIGGRFVRDALGKPRFEAVAAPTSGSAAAMNAGPSP